MDFRYRILGYGLPFMLWPAELFIRTATGNPDAVTFFAPSLASAALGLLVPSLSLRHGRRYDSAISERHLARKNEIVRYLSIVLFFIGAFVWLATVYLGVGGSWPLGWPAVRANLAEWMAGILYLIVTMLNEWRARYEYP